MNTIAEYKGLDLTGKTFGRIKVLSFHHFNIYKACRNKQRNWYVSQRNPVWECRCECGNIWQVPHAALISGNTRSCGCLHNELLGARMRTHGMTRTRLYRIWSGMWTRCTNPNSEMWHRYGGRGIKVCEQWKDFSTFKADMQDGYSNGMTIDRKDNDGPYSPENCKWSTAIEQQNNTSNSKIVEAWGRKQTVAQWCRELNLKQFTIYSRLRLGVPTEIALTRQRLKRRD